MLTTHRRSSATRRLARVLLGLCVVALGCTLSGCKNQDSPADWGERWQQMGKLGRGFLVWESNRTGRWRIWYRNLDGSGLRQLSPEEEGRDHFAPHIAPDGTQLV